MFIKRTMISMFSLSVNADTVFSGTTQLNVTKFNMH